MSADDRPNEGEILHRIGASWTDADHAALVDGLRAGLTDEELSTQLGRTTKGIRKRAKMLLGPEHSNATGRAAMELLRQQASEGGNLDWATNVRDATKREGRRYWTAADDVSLTEAWKATIPLPPARRPVRHLGTACRPPDHRPGPGIVHHRGHRSAWLHGRRCCRYSAPYFARR